MNHILSISSKGDFSRSKRRKNTETLEGSKNETKCFPTLESCLRLMIANVNFHHRVNMKSEKTNQKRHSRLPACKSLKTNFRNVSLQKNKGIYIQRYFEVKALCKRYQADKKGFKQDVSKEFVF